MHAFGHADAPHDKTVPVSCPVQPRKNCPVPSPALQPATPRRAAELIQHVMLAANPCLAADALMAVRAFATGSVRNRLFKAVQQYDWPRVVKLCRRLLPHVLRLICSELAPLLRPPSNRSGSVPSSVNESCPAPSGVNGVRGAKTRDKPRQ